MKKSNTVLTRTANSRQPNDFLQQNPTIGGVSIQIVIFTGDCTSSPTKPIEATRTIGPVESHTCNIENHFEILHGE